MTSFKSPLPEVEKRVWRLIWNVKGILRARDQLDHRNGADAGKRLPSKPQAMNPAQILYAADFARRMA